MIEYGGWNFWKETACAEPTYCTAPTEIQIQSLVLIVDLVHMAQTVLHYPLPPRRLAEPSGPEAAHHTLNQPTHLLMSSVAFIRETKKNAAS